MKKLIPVICALGLLVIGAPSDAANLVVNGSFESPGFTNAVNYINSTSGIPGWTVVGPASRNVAVHKTPNVGVELGSAFNYAQDGSYYLDLSGNGTNHPTVQQYFTTWEGFGYALSFYIGTTSSAPTATISVQVVDPFTNLNATLTPAPSTDGNINWTYFQGTFGVGNRLVLLRFRDISNSDDNNSFIDNVRISAWPPLTPFRILSIKKLYPDYCELTWESRPSFEWQVYYKDSLTDAVWTPLGDPFLTPNSIDPTKSTFRDNTTSGISQRFYQIMGR